MRAQNTIRRILTLGPLACLVLAACTKGTDISAEAPRPVSSPPRGAMSELPPMPVASAPQATAEPARPPEVVDPPGDFHLAVIVHPATDARRGDTLVDYGDRLVVLDDLPVAQAKGDGPVVASRALRRGLPKDAQHAMRVHGAAGGPAGSWLVYGRLATRGSAPDGVAYRFDGNAWQRTARYAFDHRNSMPWISGVFAWNDAGMAVVENDVVLTKDGDESTSVVKVHWFDATKRSATKPLPMFVSQAAGGSDGHVWLAGTREGHDGGWVAHLEPSGKSTWEALPGTETCGTNGMSSHGMSAREGGAVALQVEYEAGDCTGLRGVHGFVRDGRGWRQAGARPAGSELLAYDGEGRTWSAERGSLVTRDAEGKVVTRQRMPAVTRKDPGDEESPIVQVVDTRSYDAEGVATANDDGCDDASLLLRKNGDRWLVRTCTVGSVLVTAIFRERVTQTVAVIQPEEER